MNLKNKTILCVLGLGLATTPLLFQSSGEKEVVSESKVLLIEKENNLNASHKVTQPTKKPTVNSNLKTLLQARHLAETKQDPQHRNHKDCMKNIEAAVDDFLAGGNQIDDLTYADEEKLAQIEADIKNEFENFVVDENGQLVDKQIYIQQIAQASDEIGTYAEEDVDAISLNDIK